MRKASRSIARRYARALLDIAQEKGGAEALEPGLRAAAQLVEGHADLRRVLSHPALSADRKKKVAAQVWSSAPPLLRRLLDLLIERDRMSLLPAVAEVYTELWNEQRGVVAAQAVSATPLADAQQKALAAAAKTLVGREVALEATVDPALLGGVLLRMDGRTYDGSLRAQLRALRERLAPGTSSSPRN
jgi:F-type H+-transporting ATPase subunit delta